MQSNVPKTKQRISAYSLLLPPVAIVLAVAIGWPVFWYIKSRAAAAGVSAWMTHEAQLGRAWSCPNQKTGGFPFSVEISCANLLFQGEILGKTLTGSVRGFRATSPLLRTGNVLAQLDPPFAAKTSDGTFEFTMQWGDLFLDLEGQPGALDRVALAGNQVRLQGKIGGIDPVGGTFGDVSGTFVLLRDRHDHAYDFMVSFKQGSIPALNSLLDTQLPIDMQVRGTISEIDLRGAETLQDLLENWRSANGHVDITAGSLTSGQIIFDAKGGFDLDGRHRVQGKLDASFAGLDKAFRQLGVDPALITAGQVLSGLLGGGQGGGTRRVNLPLTFSKGFLSIGPVRTQIQIPPLY
ncbi:MAG: DUF2125 domain-containing protein [Methylocella sp.]|nr:MAG: hypothetical protein DLM68_17230 [Hyphomicrobiales bacterium]